MRPYTYEMVDAGGLGSVRKCPGAALADLGDVEGFDRGGEEDQLYAFQLSDGVYKIKKFTLSESLKFEQLSDVDTSHAVQGGFMTLRLLRANGLPLQTPSSKLVCSST